MVNPALRCTQFDSVELDDYLLAKITETISQNVLKYNQIKIIQKYSPHLITAIKCILYYKTYYKHGQTPAQLALDCSHYTRNSFQKILSAAVYCFDELIREELANFLQFIYQIYSKLFKIEHNQINIQQLTNRTVVAYKILSFLNEIVFLFDGKYINLLVT